VDGHVCDKTLEVLQPFPGNFSSLCAL
jgi:hypothetical protein